LAMLNFSCCSGDAIWSPEFFAASLNLLKWQRDLRRTRRLKPCEFFGLPQRLDPRKPLVY